MGEKIATRAAYGKALLEFAPQDPRLIVLDADLSCATMTREFSLAYPHRFLNLGIAEQNMMGVAAGLAACGQKPFASTFAMFAAGRAFEQVRNSIAYPHLNVVVVGSHGGLSVGEDGATHQCCEDFAVMSALPGMAVLCPCDGYEMRMAVQALLHYDGPAYLRLGRLPVDTVTDAVPGYTFQLGKGVTLRGGTDVTIAATGLMVQMALTAAQALGEQGISARVLDLPSIKPLDEALVLQAAQETGCVVTTEEHSVYGGLGSAVCRLFAGACPTPTVCHGVPDTFGRSGKAADVLAYYGLSPAGIIDAVHRALALKQG